MQVTIEVRHAINPYECDFNDYGEERYLKIEFDPLDDYAWIEVEPLLMGGYNAIRKADLVRLLKLLQED